MQDAFSSLFQSRKFWLAVADAGFSTIAIMLTLFFKPEVVDKILAVIALWQPVVIAVIVSITAQNVEGIKAGAAIESMKAYNGE